jgi:hypothetical protein
LVLEGSILRNFTLADNFPANVFILEFRTNFHS